MCVSNKPVQLSKRFFFSFLPALFCLWFHSRAWSQVQGCPIGGIPVMQAASKIGCVGGSLKFIIGYATYGVAPTPQFQFIINGNVVYTGAQDSYSVTQIAPTDVVSGYIIESGCTSAIATTQLTGLQFLPYTTPSVSIKSSQIGPSCPGSAITYTATPVNGGENPTYTWKINGVVAAVGNSVFTCDTLKDGDNVNCILTVNGNPCILANNVPSDTLTARFIPETAPSVVVTASANNVYQGTPLTFTATTLNAGTPTDYHWQVNGKSAGTNSATFTSNTLNNGDVVTCTITTNLGCIISAAGNNITVSIIPTPPITAPNTFTPNGDGINDTWKLSNLSFYPNMSIKVFNRYGTVVFQSQGYAKQWDGTEVNNNRALPDGVYFYVIDPGNNAPELSGWVAIIR